MKINSIIIFLIFSVSLIANPNVLMTGYWNPTGEMLAQFSTDAELNPDGWQGENWHDFGFDVYSYFPQPGEYTGMLEVDYQDTWEDFWQLVEELNPIAIISFGAGTGPWEIEYNARNINSWYNDYEAPYQPTPNPPDTTQVLNFVRHSTLPVNEIADAVNAETDILAWVDWNGNPGGFLCEYIAYLGMWYKDTHSNPLDENQCLSAGFIHVNNTVSLSTATLATELTLTETLEYLAEFVSFGGSIATENVDINDVIVSLIGEDQYYIFPEDNQIFLPYIQSGEYKFSAVADGFYYDSQDIIIDSTTNEIELELQQWLGEEVVSFHGEANEIYHANQSYAIEAAIRLKAEDLQEDVGNLIGKMQFYSANDSENIEIEAKIYSSAPDASEPEEMLCSFPIDDFSANEWVSRVIYSPVEIEADKDYWIGYSALAEDGNIAWLDNEEIVDGQGAYIRLGNWYQLYEATYEEGNWLIDAVVISPETGTTSENVSGQQLLLANYPNPFNPDTKINFSLPYESEIELDIYNIRGQHITNLVSSSMPKGNHTIIWNGKNKANKQVSSGVYFYRLSTDREAKTNKMILLK